MSVLTGLVVWAFALLAGLELATAWGVIAFVLNYIPFIGPLVATRSNHALGDLRSHSRNPEGRRRRSKAAFRPKSRGFRASRRVLHPERLDGVASIGALGGRVNEPPSDRPPRRIALP
jgi:hypothetical protein